MRRSVLHPWRIETYACSSLRRFAALQVAANLLGFGEIEWDQMLPSSGAAGATLVRQNASPIIGALALESGSAGARKRDSGTLATIEEAAPVAGQNATATGGGLKTPIE